VVEIVGVVWVQRNVLAAEVHLHLGDGILRDEDDHRCGHAAKVRACRKCAYLASSGGEQRC
jgi:hypothetical protein